MTPDLFMLKFIEIFNKFSHMKDTLMSPKNVSCFVQRGRIDLFEENSTGHFDAKICLNISIKFALKKVRLHIFCSIKVFLILCQHIHITFQ